MLYDYRIITDAEWLKADLLDEIRQFGKRFLDIDIVLRLTYDEKLHSNIAIGGRAFSYSCDLPHGDALNVKRMTKRFAKHSLYRALSDESGTELPWGSLTGIRPTKLAYAYLANGGSEDGIAGYLSDTFSVRRDRADIVARIVRVQRSVLPADLTGYVDLYVHIPFCNGRCNYCSFPSVDISGRSGVSLEEYTEALVWEIGRMKEFMAERGERVLSVYVGGGTPSVLGERELGRVLEAIDCRDAEFTFEAGRADSFTREKARLMKQLGVTRVCINPQTLNDDTLSRIGRRHTAGSFYEAYDIAKSEGFDLNTDIIAGLEGETLCDFMRTADGISALDPDNVTVHTLSRKRASLLADTELSCPGIEEMTEYAFRVFSGFEPYYLYRQKNMVGNLENVGFCRPGKECINNITVMEELVPVYACGAGSISKRVGKVISRYASPKDVKLYMEELAPRTEKKLDFLRSGDN